MPLKGPYRFVPLSPHVFLPSWAGLANHDVPFPDGLSGVVKFKIHAKTPLIVGGDRDKPTAAEPGVVKPFRLPDGTQTLAIPGSSLRGMIRNVLEIASFAKFQTLDNKRFQIRQVTPNSRYLRKMTGAHGTAFGPKTKAGILRFKGNAWDIVPVGFARIDRSELSAIAGNPAGFENRFKGEHVAGNFQGRTTIEKYQAWSAFNQPLTQSLDIEPTERSQTRHTPPLWYRMARRITNATAASTTGLLVFTGQPNTRKHMEFVFLPPAVPLRPLPVSDAVKADFEGLQRNLLSGDMTELETSWGWLKQRYASGKQERLAKDIDGIPVFYLPAENNPNLVTAIGVSMMFPLPSEHSVYQARDRWQAIVDDEADDLEEERMDLAETVFGKVGSKPGETLRGRVSFATARPVDSKSIKVTEAPAAAIRLSPKPSFGPAYLVLNLANHGSTGWDNPGTAPQPAGWKRYPVRRVQVIQKIAEGLENKRLIQTRLQTIVASEASPVTFTGELRFHNLRPVELGAVLWAMTFGVDAACHHSLGGGKPDGNGRVLIELQTDDWNANVIANKVAYDAATGAVTATAVPTAQACMDAFAARMTKFVTGKGLGTCWRNTAQIKTLMGMADVAKSNPAHQPADHWHYMELAQHALARGGNWQFPLLPQK